MDLFDFGQEPTPRVVTQRNASWTAGAGTYEIKTRASAEEIRALRISDKIQNFHPPEQEKEILAQIASGLNANVTFAAHEETLVGYLAIEKPDPRIRWGKSDIKPLHELEVIEVSRNHRRHGLAKKMLELAFSDPWVDELIVLSTEYAWHWDLEDTGLNAESYRWMMHELFASSAGFEELETDEPNILSDHSNLFMVRRGKNVSPVDWSALKQLLVSDTGEPQPAGPSVRGRHKEFQVEP